MRNQVLEFFREGRRRPAPGWFIGLCRVFFGAMWLYNAGGKAPPDFGQTTGAGPWGGIQQAVQYAAFPRYQTFLESVVAPNLAFWGWLLFLSELAVGLFMVLGLFTRLFAALGLLLSVNLWVATAAHPTQTGATYWPMILFHALFIATNAGLNWGLDQILLEKLANSSLRRTAWGRRLIRYL
jgi:thiosulfate dehydrogenase [quinone] large subunit